MRLPGIVFIWLLAFCRLGAGLFDTPAVIQPSEPRYPSEAIQAGIEGDVVIRFEIKPDGSVSTIKPLSGNVVLQGAVVDALSQRKYDHYSITNRGQLISLMVCYEFKLVGESGKPEVRATDLPETRWRKTIFPPVYPFELLAKKRSGVAEVAFLVNPDGQVAEVTIREASDQAFGLALQAQVEGLQLAPFSDEKLRGRPRYEILRRKFSPEGSVEVPVAELSRLLASKSPNAPKVFSKDEVDQPPVAIKTVAPNYPVALMKRGPKGEALIEFVVDELGVPRAIRVISSTKKEFGFAGAQAVSQWKFKPALKSGSPVPFLRQVSFSFQLAPD